MQRDFGGCALCLVLGDLSRHPADAIVNAANPSLLGGGGVDGALHEAGGPAILEEARRLGGCEPGDAKLTGPGRLPARCLVHAVGPIWQGGGAGEDEVLARAYRRSLELGAEQECRTVAFPSLSTGAYGFPVERAARVALRTIARLLRGAPGLFDRVTMVLFSQPDLDSYSAALAELESGP